METKFITCMRAADKCASPDLTRTVLFGVSGAMALLWAGICPADAAEPFPAKPIHIIVPSGAGGALDIITRIVAEKMGEKLKQTVIVENRNGAETQIGTRYVKNARPDGYTILAQAEGFTATPLLRPGAGYNAITDFTGIGMMLRAPQLMYVGSGEPAKSVTQFIERAKASPGQLTYAHAGLGTPMHLSGAQFIQKTGIDVVAVPYNGSALSYPDVASGRVNTIFAGYSGGLSYLASGKMRPLGVTGERRMPALPNVPTLKEQGVDFTYYYWLGLVAPAGTPKEVISKLYEGLKYAVSSDEMHERYQVEGAENLDLSPEQFNTYLTEEAEANSKLIQTVREDRK
ncbi:Bug family tripartite tricarboxylate transporter substrate binding protein [Advenella mimigardefordensis]|uniref:Putative Bug-like extracytoplasmic solute binding receptor, TTT family n=1 Tax=Advenella mimigardefordensis (strain DSM 17166 / LMG 22922 / DPN7) TaxID=1247726 RepID=W0PBL5_ADVMD|nr:tripartite tricarboxylate transporter substrate binding protein [Advenella mimigardefordensis]AHG64136.1 putative Bug-like extracytoplasmic solute binding receptor, TTT family [Advenella mimigardefordensis DPN7]